MMGVCGIRFFWACAMIKTRARLCEKRQRRVENIEDVRWGAGRQRALPFLVKCNGLAQYFEIFEFRNLNRSKLFQVWSCPLGVQQNEVTRAEPLNQGNEGNFGGIGDTIKHA